jgi:hypothetical protein
MNIKEEAKKLVNKFETHTSTEFRAIECALLCVDEMYSELFDPASDD